MKIFIDIGHPAHVHYFKNVIKLFSELGNDVFITARDKEVTHSLLIDYGISFRSRGKGRESLLGKFVYMFKADYLMLKYALRFKPDIFLSFASPYAAHTAKLMNVPHIAFDDTEHATFSYKLYRPFTDKIFVPKFYKGKIQKNVSRFNGIIELAYLEPKYLNANDDVRKHLSIGKDEFFSLVRFVSWNANHDQGHKGLNNEEKIFIVKKLLEHGQVFISSECELPAGLQKYGIKIRPSMMHSVLKEAGIYVGESGTMATEASLLGTPSVNISSSAPLIGVFDALKSAGLMHVCVNYNEAMESIKSILKKNKVNPYWELKRNQFIEGMVDVNKFIIEQIYSFKKKNNGR